MLTVAPPPLALARCSGVQEPSSVYLEAVAQTGAALEVWDLGGARPAVEELCAALGHSPLALTRAAHLAHVLSPAALAERIRAASDGDERVGLAAVLLEPELSAWSATLSPATRDAWATLALVSTPITLEDAEAILGTPLAESFAELVAGGAVRRVSAGRFALHPLARAFARSHLPWRGHRRRYVGWVAARARLVLAPPSASALGGIPGTTSRMASTELTEEIARALAMLDALHDAGDEPTDARACALDRATLTLALVTLETGGGDARLALLDAAIAALDAQRAPDDAIVSAWITLWGARTSTLAALGRYERARIDQAAMLDRFDGDARATLLLRWAIMQRFEGRLAEARRAHELLEPLISTPALARRARACVARLACDRGEAEAGRLANEHVLEEATLAGDGLVAGLALSNLGQLAAERGRPITARRAFERSIPLFRGVSPDNELSTLTMLGDLALELGDPAAAMVHYDRARGVRHTAALSRAMLGFSRALALGLLGRLDDAHAERLAAGARLVGCPRTAAAAAALVGATLDLLEARASGEGTDEATRRLTRALDGDPSVDATLDVRGYRRLARAVLRRGFDRGACLGLDSTRRHVTVGERGVDLSRRPTLFRLLSALVDQHATSPGRPLDRASLIGRTWPGERILHDAAATRLRVAVAHLRRLGLRDVLDTHEDGYRLAPNVVLRRRDAEQTTAPQPGSLLLM
jgi:hypothetical protein